MRFVIYALMLWAGIFIAQAGNAQTSDDVAPQRIIAVGDLHGDFEAWMVIAGRAGIVDEIGEWAGGETTLVQMGDVTDRGPDSLKIIRHLQALRRGAQEAGGDVIVLLGNHEAMNVSGDLRYVHPGEYEAFRDRGSKRRRDATWRANRELLENVYAEMEPPLDADQAKARWYADTPLGKLEHRRAWMPGGELAQWAGSLPAIAKLGRTLFVHGGLSAERSIEPMATINARISGALVSGDPEYAAILDDPLGPLWYRGNIIRDPAGEDPNEPVRPTIEQELDQVLAFYGADRLVVAHTPSTSGIETGGRNRLLRIDTGIAAHYGGPYSYLEIVGDKAIAHQRLADGGWVARDASVTKGAVE